jgi:hypothetical protein
MLARAPLVAALLALLAASAGAPWPAAAAAAPRGPVALVHPQAGHTRLDLDPAGLAFLESLEGPVAPVVVIGPYRSGKSFLLNSLLGVSCEEGFGVGHTRETQTLGVWLWPRAVEVAGKGGERVNVSAASPQPPQPAASRARPPTAASSPRPRPAAPSHAAPLHRHRGLRVHRQGGRVRRPDIRALRAPLLCADLQPARGGAFRSNRIWKIILKI